MRNFNDLEIMKYVNILPKNSSPVKIEQTFVHNDDEFCVFKESSNYGALIARNLLEIRQIRI